MFHDIVLMFFPLNSVAFWRRVISARRGCFQLPGLSVIGAAAVCLTGVRTDLVAMLVEDMIAVEKKESWPVSGLFAVA